MFLSWSDASCWCIILYDKNYTFIRAFIITINWPVISTEKATYSVYREIKNTLFFIFIFYFRFVWWFQIIKKILKMIIHYHSLADETKRILIENKKQDSGLFVSRNPSFIKSTLTKDQLLISSKSLTINLFIIIILEIAEYSLVFTTRVQ